MQIIIADPVRNTLPDSYFESYAGYRYGEHWKHTPIFSANDVKAVWDSIEKELPFSILDIGAANGSMLENLKKEFGSYVSYYGVESSNWGKKNALPKWKDNIIWEDWLDASSKFKDNSIDLILDTAAMYVDYKNLDKYLKECARVVNKRVFTLVLFKEHSEKFYPDPQRKILESKKWWNEKIKQFSTVFNMVGITQTWR